MKDASMIRPIIASIEAAIVIGLSKPILELGKKPLPWNDDMLKTAEAIGASV
ncbi:MAG: hypothetical protein H0U76_13845 [Ktedonobacteraceae bacterium]|nr:hypothetical protein [Ktedonobacteraceae bacterium]